MAQPRHQVEVHTTQTQRYDTTPGSGTTYSQYPKQHYHGEGDGGLSTFFSERGPSISQILAVLVGLPIGGTLLFLAGVSLIASLIGLAIVTPLFIFFSPVLVPAILTIGLAVAGILTADAYGLTGLMSLSLVVSYFREMVPGQQGGVYSTVKGGVADVAGYVGQKTKDVGQKTKDVGQKTKEVGQDVQKKAQESKRST